MIPQGVKEEEKFQCAAVNKQNQIPAGILVFI
jgi:hypothetical protein